jgi:type I restriction enzyme, S subunit
MKGHYSPYNKCEGSNPEGWVETTLSVAGKWSSGGTPSRKNPKNFDGSIPWVKISDLNDGIVTATEETITEDGLNSSAAQLLPAGTICIGIYGSIGKLGILGIAAATNQACANCIPDKDVVDPRFLFWYLRGQRQVLLDSGKGGTQANITNQIIREWPFLLPPLAEQRRIVRKVDELIERLASIRTRISRVSAILKRFRQAVLVAACSGRLTIDWRESHGDIATARDLIRQILDDRTHRYHVTRRMSGVNGNKLPKPPKNLVRQQVANNDLPEIPDTWEWVCWDDLADWITYGFTRPMPHVPQGVPIITATNVRDGFIDFSNCEYTTSQAFAELSEKDKPRRNEILITKDGAIRGRAALVETDDRFCVSQAVAVVRFGGLTAYEPFLLRVIQSRFTQNLIEEESMGTAIPHISITNFGRFAVPLPPLPEQKEIVRRVKALFHLAHTIEGRLSLATESMKKLTQAVFAKAFRGELVPTEAELAQREGRDYEPASVLLERIRAERTDQVKSPPASKRRLKKSTAVVGA